MMLSIKPIHHNYFLTDKLPDYNFCSILLTYERSFRSECLTSSALALALEGDANPTSQVSSASKVLISFGILCCFDSPCFWLIGGMDFFFMVHCDIHF